MQLISEFVDTYLRLTAAEQQQFQAELAQVAPEAREDIMKIVTSWMEEGLQQGLAQGKRDEALRLVLRLLEGRIGPVEPALQPRIQALSLPRLEELGEALLDFTSAADLVAWLDAHGELHD